MAMQTAFRSDEHFTQAEFFEWLQERPGSDPHHYELLDGRIVMTPPAGYPHGGVAAKILGPVQTHVSAAMLGEVFDSSAGFDLPSGDSLEPDLSFISTERFLAGPRPVRGRFLRIVPDLVVEILSPSTARRDRVEKRRIYARNGVREYWLVDEPRREVAVLGDDGLASERLYREGRIASSVLTGLLITVEDIFAGLCSDFVE
jgi:Uma2 family endonuclease